MGEIQEQINQSEWSNAANWRAPKLFGLYSSRADTRLWVPKRTASLGWTLNLGHPQGKTTLAALLAGVAGLIVSGLLFGGLLLRVLFSSLQYAI